MLQPRVDIVERVVDAGEAALRESIRGELGRDQVVVWQVSLHLFVTRDSVSEKDPTHVGGCLGLDGGINAREGVSGVLEALDDLAVELTEDRACRGGGRQ